MAKLSILLTGGNYGTSFGRELMKTLRYVRDETEKGPMLVEGIQKALLEPHPALREKREPLC